MTLFTLSTMTLGSHIALVPSRSAELGRYQVKVHCSPINVYSQGQFNYAEVVVSPLVGGMNKVTVRTKKGGYWDF